jgi:hypothetical protein
MKRYVNAAMNALVMVSYGGQDTARTPASLQKRIERAQRAVRRAALEITMKSTSPRLVALAKSAERDVEFGNMNDALAIMSVIRDATR